MTEAPGDPAFFRAIVEGLGEGIVIIDAHGSIRWASRSLELATGHAGADWVGRPIFEVMHPEDAEKALARRTSGIGSEWRSWRAIRRIRLADGGYRAYDCTTTDLTDSDVGGYVVVLRGADEQHTWEAEHRLRAIVEHSADAVVIFNREGRTVYASPVAQAFVGDTTGSILDSIRRLTHPDQVADAIALYESCLASPGATVRGRFEIMRSKGPQWIELQGTNLLDDPVVGGVVINARDVTDSVELEAELRHAARHDPLTGLPNRAQLIGDLTLALAQPERGKVSVLFMDLDRFKVVNDSFGHATGDLVLLELGQRLQAAVGWRGTVGRFGGDEYVVVTIVDAHEDATTLARALIDVASEPFTVTGPEHERVEVFLSGTVGIAVAGTADDASSLLHHADAAMYRAKARGPGSWEVYDDGMRQASHHRLTLESDLIRALDDEAFELHYQPIVDLATSQTSGFEALARWTHPVRGKVPPSEFIPVLEETGGIHRLGRWVLEAACSQLHDWRRSGGVTVNLSLNLSPQQLSQDDLAADIVSVTRAYGVDPERLTFEITEMLLMRDLNLAVKALSRLRDIGCRLALDDFGTGWSSLTYLRSVPVDEVKIDRSFIEGVTDSPQDRAIVGSVVWLCRTLGKLVVAEGVETAEQYDALAQLGCTHAQGFYIARPVPATDALTYLGRPAD
jgi:diguanylate cyclase (GGDEF)-like protein/PAS domain S-box-containing protein